MLLEFSSCAPHKCSVPAAARLETKTRMDVAEDPMIPVTEKRCQVEVIGNGVLTITPPVWSWINRLAVFVPDGVFTQQLNVKVWLATGTDGVTNCPMKPLPPATE